MKKFIASLLCLFTLAACDTDANVASRNLSIDADNFKISRRIVFYNGITGEYMLTIEGLCSLGNFDKAERLSVTCKVGHNEYKKHFLGLSDNVTFFVEQVEPAKTNLYFYKVSFKPSVILPNLELN